MIKYIDPAESQRVLGGWLIDGTGGRTRQNVILELKAGKIHAIQPATPDDIRRPGMVDLSGCTVMPGLIDSHVHLFMSGTDEFMVRRFQLEAGLDDLKEVIERHLKQHQARGIVAVRDGGDRKGLALEYKTTHWDASKTPVHMKVGGRAWHRRGRYGRLIGRSPKAGQTLAEAIGGDLFPGDCIKIVNSGLNSLIQFGRETACQFNGEELSRAVRAAGVQGRDVMVHANGKRPVQIAIESGCRSVEHGFFMGTENLRKMADKQIFWVPTAVTMHAYAQHLKRRGQGAQVAQKNLDHQLEQIRIARDMGVPIALGTDAGSLGVHHGRSVMEEMKLFMEAGLTPAEAVRCATFNNAGLLGLEGSGALERGMPACFIATTGGPECLPESLGGISAASIPGIFPGRG